MESTKGRMMVIAVLVCGFAVGMAGLLNYFKYRSTVHELVKERIVVTGSMVEKTIQSSLLLGLEFADIGTLPGTLERERSTDDYIVGIDVFDTEGRMLYSTDRLRAARSVPSTWVAAAKKASRGEWFVEGATESAAGVAIENNLGLPMGYIALRYSNERVDRSVREIGRELAIASLAVFAVSAALSSFALLGVMRRMARDVAAVESALRAADPVRASAVVGRGIFGMAPQRFAETVRAVESEIAGLRGRMQRGAAE